MNVILRPPGRPIDRAALPSATCERSAAWAQGEPLLAAAGEFRNPVEGHNWRAVAITSDSEHVLGASDAKDAHVIFAWSRFGKRQLAAILEGETLRLPWTPPSAL